MSSNIRDVRLMGDLDKCISHMQKSREFHLVEEKSFLNKVNELYKMIKDTKHRANCAANSAHSLRIEIDYAKTFQKGLDEELSEDLLRIVED